MEGHARAGWASLRCMQFSNAPRASVPAPAFALLSFHEAGHPDQQPGHTSAPAHLSQQMTGSMSLPTDSRNSAGRATCDREARR